jgi:glycosyltransferase involved in cell wall biosynthesis
LNLQTPNFLELRVYNESIVIERCAIINVNNNFEVIHLSTSYKGGAGIAARRLNSELNSVGVKSSFYAIAKQDFTLGLNEYSIERSFYRLVQAYLSTLLSKLTINITFFSIFSSSSFSLKWFKSRIKTENTVIHIHNWFNLLSFRQLQKIIEIGIPVVVTLHDQRLITGGCHASLDCKNFENGCKKCPMASPLLHSKIRKNSRDLRKLFNNSYYNLKLTTPSNFMVGQASKSWIMSSQKVTFLPNSIPKYENKSFSRTTVTSKSIFRVGVASANPDDPLKGGDLVYELEKILKRNTDDIKIVYLVNFPSEKDFDFWINLDCLLVPSRGDNSPNVIHEAKQFGLPIIATKVGGITEMLFPDVDTLIDVSELSAQSILSAIISVKGKKFDAKTIERMQKAYLEYVGEPLNKTIEIYQELLAAKSSTL